TPTDAGNFTFTVRVTDSSNNTDEKSFSKEVYVTLPPLQIRVLKGGSRTIPGRQIIYIIFVQNIGTTTANNIEVVEFLEPWFKFIFATPNPSQLPPPNFTLNATIGWNISTLAPGEFRMLSYRVRLASTLPLGLTVSGEACEGKGDACWNDYKDCVLQGTSSCFIPCAISGFIPDPFFINPDACGLCLDGVRDFCKLLNNFCFPPSGDLTCDNADSLTSMPFDPNEKIVTPSGFIKSNQNLIYAVHFENIGNTSALDVFVSDKLSNNLNLSKLQVIAKNGTFIPIQEGQTALLFEQQKNQTIIIGNISINITINETWTVNLLNGMLNWSLINIDLPVNGTDELLFSIKPKQNLTSGTEIRNNATIQFEIFTPIVTNDTVNIIDEIPSICTMNPLPNITTTLTFPIYWTGNDPIGEIESYVIFSSVNDGGFIPVINSTSSTNSTFTGQQGKTYRFICIATDTAGNIEVQPPTSEATTTIPNPTLTVIGTPTPGSTVTFNLTDLVNPGANYILAMSQSNTPGIQLSDGRVISLNGDGLFFISLFYPNIIGFFNSQGVLNSNGNAIATWNIPSWAPSSFTIYLAAVTINPSATLPEAILGISNAISVTIQ
ncbi:MAG: hypothetical protein AABY07_07215, partial [Nanoarchaeota archaeon]